MGPHCPGHVSHDPQADEPLRRSFGCGRGTGGVLLRTGTLLYHVPLADAWATAADVLDPHVSVRDMIFGRMTSSTLDGWFKHVLTRWLCCYQWKITINSKRFLFVDYQRLTMEKYGRMFNHDKP